MNKKLINVLAALLTAAAFSVPALANEAKTLDELLELIQSAKISAVSYTHLTLPTNREV